MSTLIRPFPQAAKAAGMTLVEAVFATLLLSICLVPAANSLRGALAAPGNMAAEAGDLDCVSALMETVVSEPYDQLFAAAGAITVPSSYSTPAKDSCPALSVFISKYGNDSTGVPGTPGTSNYLLYVSVRVANAGNGGFPLTTLVAR